MLPFNTSESNGSGRLLLLGLPLQFPECPFSDILMQRMRISNKPGLPSDDVHRIIDERVAPERREGIWAPSECCAARKPNFGQARAHV